MQSCLPLLILHYAPKSTADIFSWNSSQVMAGAPRTVTERCCACYHRHSEVWSRSGSDTAQPTALARRSRPGSLQACSDSLSVSERPRTTVSVGARHPGLQCWHAAASAFHQPSPTGRTAFRLNTYGCRAFSVAVPVPETMFPDFIRDPTSSTDCRRIIETYMFARY